MLFCFVLAFVVFSVAGVSCLGLGCFGFGCPPRCVLSRLFTYISSSASSDGEGRLELSERFLVRGRFRSSRTGANEHAWRYAAVGATTAAAGDTTAEETAALSGF